MPRASKLFAGVKKLPSNPRFPQVSPSRFELSLAGTPRSLPNWEMSSRLLLSVGDLDLPVHRVLAVTDSAATSEKSPNVGERGR